MHAFLEWKIGMSSAEEDKKNVMYWREQDLTREATTHVQVGFSECSFKEECQWATSHGTRHI